MVIGSCAAATAGAAASAKVTRTFRCVRIKASVLGVGRRPFRASVLRSAAINIVLLRVRYSQRSDGFLVGESTTMFGVSLGDSEKRGNRGQTEFSQIPENGSLPPISQFPRVAATRPAVPRRAERRP